MEFIASFSFLHCQFLPLLTGDPPPFASFNLRSFYELPLPIPPLPLLYATTLVSRCPSFSRIPSHPSYSATPSLSR